MTRTSTTILPGQTRDRLRFCLALLAQGPGGALQMASDQAPSGSHGVQWRTLGRERCNGGDVLAHRGTRWTAILGHRLRAVIAALVLAGSCLAAAASAASAANFTWSGAAAAGESKWSDGTNWEGGLAPAGSVGTLTFPALSSSACTAEPPTATCYQSNNNTSGLSVNSISIANGVPYSVTGEPITLGAGGLTASPGATGTPSGLPLFDLADLNVPVALSSPQTWSIIEGKHGRGLRVGGNVSGTTADSLQIAFSEAEPTGEPNFVELNGDVEVGPVKVAGPSGFVSLGSLGSEPNGHGSLNGTDGNPVTFESFGASLVVPENGKVGALTFAEGSDLQLGVSPGPSAPLLTVNGSVTFHQHGFLFTGIAHPGMVAGIDYSQLGATGTIGLGGVGLSLSGACVLHVGDVDALVTTTGSLTGTFNEIPDGTTIPIHVENEECTTAPTVRINYTEHAVTATVESAGTPAQPRDVSPPKVSGMAQQGQTLTEEHGMWRNRPTTYSYKWERCDGSGNNCHPIEGATAQNYTLSTADVGSTIRVFETASNEGGSSEPAASAPTLPVQSAPSSPPGGGGGGGGAGGGGGGGGGVLGYISKVLPSPVVGGSEEAAPVSGTVLIKLPGAHGFTALTSAMLIPDGSELDATNGRVRLLVASGVPGVTNAVELYGGRFIVHQTTGATPRTYFILSQPLTGCQPPIGPAHIASAVEGLDARAKSHKGPRSRHLWVTEHGGRFNTQGQYVSTSVEGTTWLTSDTCTSSSVTVTQGVVKVRDLVRRRTVTVPRVGATRPRSDGRPC